MAQGQRLLYFRDEPGSLTHGPSPLPHHHVVNTALRDTLGLKGNPRQDDVTGFVERGEPVGTCLEFTALGCIFRPVLFSPRLAFDPPLSSP